MLKKMVNQVLKPVGNKQKVKKVKVREKEKEKVNEKEKRKTKEEEEEENTVSNGMKRRMEVLMSDSYVLSSGSC